MLEVKGVVAALVTPFDEHGNVVTDELVRLASRLIRAGVHGLFVVSNAGEFFSLEEKEKHRVLDAVLETAAGRVSVYFGPGAIATREAVHLAKMAEDAGVDAISVISPYFVKLTDDELYEHYRTIASATRLPLVIYSNPAYTGIKVSSQVVERLSKVDNIVGIKDSSGDLALTQAYIEIHPDFAVLAGRDGLILATLLHGGKGAISSLANVCPELIVEIYEKATHESLLEAVKAQKKVARLRELVGLGTFPAAIKYALTLQGFRVGEARAPVQPLGKQQRLMVKDFLVKEGLTSQHWEVNV